MSYVVIARKWRPQHFSDVLGQEHITRTLTNAINASRIAHAFLFSGPRGVGKTSAARILAKALCCEKTGVPTATPCGECRQCLEITEGRSTDVFEIDAASHTGVDNVREIIENVRYLPSSARFKIYVIDEVHMLSTGAFNALLKTLEEPPLHVKFILATTDVHKVPVTILSRCQRYDFRRIPLVEIASRLSKILEREGIAHDASALSLIAREAEGSMRDAQSLLEQVLAFADGRRLDPALVREALGVVDGALVERAFEALRERAPGKLIDLVGEVYDRGLDLKRFGDALLEHARDLLVAKLVPEPGATLDRPRDEVGRLVEHARQWDVAAIERLFDALSRIVEELGKAQHPRFSLEIGLASIAEKPERVPLEALSAQLEKIERTLAAVAPSPTSPIRRASAADWRAPGRTPPQYAARGSSNEPCSGFEGREMPASPAAVRTMPTGDAVASEDSAEGESDEAPAAGGSTGEVRDPRPMSAGPPSNATFQSFVDLLRRKRPSLAAMLAQVRPLVFRPGDTELGCETAFDESKLEDAEVRRYLEALLYEFFGKETRLRISRTARPVPGTGPLPGTETLNEAAERSREARVSEKGSAARARPAVKAIAEELGGTIAKIRVLDEG